jgi:HK97 family phage portal protein
VSLFGRQRRLYGIAGAQDFIPGRMPSGTGSVVVTNDTAMRHSAVWACLRLRADLVSTMPVDVFRMVDGVQVEMPKPPMLVSPGGDRIDILEWMYSSQVDLDRAGNAFGLITERNALGLPNRIDLMPLGTCSVIEKPGQPLQYRIDGKIYDTNKVWHERQYTVSGLPVGLSPVAYAAWTIGQYQSAQRFATDWYGTGGIPKASLRNVARSEVSQAEAEGVKAKFKAATEGRDLFVTSREWEYTPIQAESVGSEWLEAQKYGVSDIARFFGCPGDLIDAAVSTGSITYANVTQRNMQFLIMHLGPAVVRRENALSKLLPRPRFVKFNTSALLRMDDITRAQVIKMRLDARTLTPSEARRLDNLPPLTAEDLAEITAVYGPAKPAPAKVPAKTPQGV